MCIGAADELSRAVVHFEGSRHFPAGFTGKERMVEFLSEGQSRFNGRDWKATPAGRRRGDRRGGGPDHIDGDNRPLWPVPAHALRQVINYDRFLHSSPSFVPDSLAERACARRSS